MQHDSMVSASRPIQGVGIGLRAPHISTILAHKPAAPWFEVLTDNYLQEGGIALYNLERIRVDYPLVLHGVGLSLGSTDALNWDYLKRLKRLAQQLAPAWISEHLCWTSVGGRYFHELLPLPYTEEALKHVIQRIQQVQDFLGQRILIENVSSYLSYQHATLPEWEFLTQVALGADCEILLDINNVFVSATNHHFEPRSYLTQLPKERIRQFHLAGYQAQPHYLLDAHSAPVQPPVWELYEAALARFGAVPTALEWDTQIPAFAQLQAEAQKAQQLQQALPTVHTVLSTGIELKPPANSDLPQSIASLQQLQQDFALALCQQTLTPHLTALIRPPAVLTAAQSIAIYRDSMNEALLLTLNDIYPVCRQLVGADFFRAMTWRYVQQTPSVSPDLGDYGASLADFIAHFPPAAAVPYLADMARLERAWWTMLHSLAIAPIHTDWAALATVQEAEQARITFQLTKPHYLFTSPYPIQQIWQAHQDNTWDEIKSAWNGDAIHLFLWRVGFTVKIETLTALEWTLLQALQQGEDLATLSETLSAYDTTLDLAQLLPTFVQRGWVTDFRVAERKYKEGRALPTD